MKEIVYVCNVCEDRKQEAGVIGLEWASSNALRKLPPGSAQTHVCLKCLKELAAIQDVINAGKPNLHPLAVPG